MKSLTSISQGFDKWTKATLQNNCFWGTPRDDCFCFEILKTILIWRSSRKININKNLVILYYLWKKLSKFFNAQKKVFYALFFQLCSAANSKFSFYVSLCEINCIKIQAMSLVSKSIYFSRDSLCFIYFDVIICQRLKKKFKLVEVFFQSREWNKNVVLCNSWYCACSDILQSRDFQSHSEDLPLHLLIFHYRTLGAFFIFSTYLKFIDFSAVWYYIL